jgi:hypothetical protein
MKNRIYSIARSTLLLICAACAAAAWSMQSGRTPQGLAYASGGVSDEELVALHAKRDAYSFWVVTAALTSGAHLAEVSIKIRDASQRTVFSGQLDGPWLFIDLPLGRYEVEAALAGQIQKRFTTIHRGDRHQMFFYFNTGDNVAPAPRGPFETNPYDGQRK